MGPADRAHVLPGVLQVDDRRISPQRRSAQADRDGGQLVGARAEGAEAVDCGRAGASRVSSGPPLWPNPTFLQSGIPLSPLLAHFSSATEQGPISTENIENAMKMAEYVSHYIF